MLSLRAVIISITEGISGEYYPNHTQGSITTWHQVHLQLYDLDIPYVQYMFYWKLLDFYNTYTKLRKYDVYPMRS